VLARPSTSLAPRILILGGGFAGVTAALELAKRCAGVLPVHVTLVSDRNFFLFTPMLAEAATGAVDGFFLEVHDDPDNALSDRSTQLDVATLADLIRSLTTITALARKTETR